MELTGTYMEVGRVVGPHGVSGKIKVAPFSGDPSGLLSAARLRIAGGSSGNAVDAREYAVETAHRSGGCAVFSLKGIDSPEEADRLSGATVAAAREDLPAPGEDEYYWADLMGCEVVLRDGDRIGAVTGVIDGPAHDWLVVRRGEEDSFLPLVAAFVLEVDVSARRIVAAPPAGW